MITTQATAAADYLFRHARVWSLIHSSFAAAVLLAVGIATVVLQSLLPLLLLPIVLAMFSRQLLRHYSERIGLFGYSVGISHGLFATHTITFPLWRIHLEIDQSLLGRIFNYGSIHILYEGVWYQCDGIGNFRMLQTLILHRQSELTMPSHILIHHANEVSSALRRIK